MATRSPFMDILEDRPEIAYYSHLDDRSYSAPKRRWLRNQFSDVQSRYLGALGSQIRRGENPTLRFNDFLGNLNFDDYYQENFSSLSPSYRNQYTSRYTPRVRQLLRF